MLFILVQIKERKGSKNSSINDHFHQIIGPGSRLIRSDGEPRRVARKRNSTWPTRDRHAGLARRGTLFFSFDANVSGEKRRPGNTPDETCTREARRTHTGGSGEMEEQEGRLRGAEAGAGGEEKGRSSESKVETWLMRRILR